MEDFGGFSEALFPTTNTIFNTGGTFNIGDYSDPTADKLINASVFGSERSSGQDRGRLPRHEPAGAVPAER